MKTFILTLLVIMTLVRLEAAEINDFKIGLTCTPNRSGLGTSLRLNKTYFNFEYGKYGLLSTVEKYSIHQIFSSIDARHLYIGLSYINTHDVNIIVPKECIPFEIGVDFGLGIDTKKNFEIIASTGIFIAENYPRFEIRVGLLFSFIQSYKK